MSKLSKVTGKDHSLRQKTDKAGASPKIDARRREGTRVFGSLTYYPYFRLGMGRFSRPNMKRVLKVWDNPIASETGMSSDL